MHSWRHLLHLAACLPLALAFQCAGALESGTELRDLFEREVDRRIELPESEQNEYAQRLADSLAAHGLADLLSQYFVLVDRDPHVQAVMIYWKSAAGEYRFIGAAPASTGRPGEYEHFETPTGVFEHSVASFDFRAEGTVNEFGIRGYGVTGMRVYDFGWVTAERGWGRPGQSAMRLQMHATDPDLLEPQLGLMHSKGCIRIPATVNVFIDRYAILDADYERARAEGKRVWVLRADRIQTPWSGRYLVIVTSGRTKRPDWSPLPRGRAAAAPTAHSLADPRARLLIDFDQERTAQPWYVDPVC